MAYKFSDTHKLNEKFRRIYGVGFNDFYDGLMSVASGHICIDVIKFDDWLHDKYGNYEDSGQSMKELIRDKYGEQSVKLIEDLIEL